MWLKIYVHVLNTDVSFSDISRHARAPSVLLLHTDSLWHATFTWVRSDTNHWHKKNQTALQKQVTRDSSLKNLNTHHLLTPNMPFSFMEHKRRCWASDNYVCEENKYKFSFVEDEQISYKTQCRFKANNYYFFSWCFDQSGCSKSK